MRWDNANGKLQLCQAQNRGEGWQTIPLQTGADTKNEFERNDLFLNEMRHFLQVASGEAQPLITLEDGIQALRLALAAHQSAQLGKLISL